jgi:hypothetical protein
MQTNYASKECYCNASLPVQMDRARMLLSHHGIIPESVNDNVKKKIAKFMKNNGYEVME